MVFVEALDSLSFQIPMRGNEILLPCDPIPACVGFQIPMRGNEIAVITAILQDESMFQIPMRGNETP